MARHRKIGKLPCPYCGGKHTTKLPCGLDVRDLPDRDLAIVATQGSEKEIRHAARAEFGKRVGVIASYAPNESRCAAKSKTGRCSRSSGHGGGHDYYED